MNRGINGRIELALLAALLTWGTLYARQHPTDSSSHGQNAPTSSMQGMDMNGTGNGTPQTIFCPTMKTGQLCSHGTADALKLSGAERDRWLAAVRRYNASVDQATRQLQADAKTILTPQQNTEVKRWFALGLNPEINKILQNGVKKSPSQGM